MSATKTTFVDFKQHDPQSVADLSGVAGDPLIAPESLQTEKNYVFGGSAVENGSPSTIWGVKCCRNFYFLKQQQKVSTSNYYKKKTFVVTFFRHFFSSHFLLCPGLVRTSLFCTENRFFPFKTVSVSLAPFQKSLCLSAATHFFETWLGVSFVANLCSKPVC